MTNGKTIFYSVLGGSLGIAIGAVMISAGQVSYLQASTFQTLTVQRSKQVEAAAAKNPYELTDGYFVGSFPAHLVHDDAKLITRLGDGYNLQLQFKINVGAPNPCSRREEKECRLVQQVIVKDSSGKEEFVVGWKEGLAFSAGDEKIGAEGESVGFGIPSTTIPRTASTKNAYLVVKIVRDDKELFRKEWPLEIR